MQDTRKPISAHLPVSLSLVFDGQCYFKAPGLPELQAWLSSFHSSAGTFPDEIIVLEALAFKALWKKIEGGQQVPRTKRS